MAIQEYKSLRQKREEEYFRFRTEIDHHPLGSISYTVPELYKAIEKNKLSKEELSDIIVKQADTLLSDNLFLHKEDYISDYARELYSNDKYLEAYCEAVGKMRDIDYMKRTFINKLAFNSIKSLESINLYDNKLARAATFCNSYDVLRITNSCGDRIAQLCIMANYSSYDNRECINNLHRVFLLYPVDISLQNYVDLIANMFKDGFTDFFVYTMLNTDRYYDYISKELEDAIYDRISRATLCILDSMPSERIRKILFSYAYTLKMHPEYTNDYYVRFSLKYGDIPQRIYVQTAPVENSRFADLVIP